MASPAKPYGSPPGRKSEARKSLGRRSVKTDGHRRIVPADQSELDTMLTKHGFDPCAVYHFLPSLFQDVKDGNVRLAVVLEPVKKLVRHIEVVRVQLCVFNSVLVETHRRLGDGRVEALCELPFEILQRGETHEEAVQRALAKALDMMAYDVSQQFKCSKNVSHRETRNISMTEAGIETVSIENYVDVELSWQSSWSPPGCLHFMVTPDVEQPEKGPPVKKITHMYTWWPLSLWKAVKETYGSGFDDQPHPYAGMPEETGFDWILKRMQPGDDKHFHVDLIHRERSSPDAAITSWYVGVTVLIGDRREAPILVRLATEAGHHALMREHQPERRMLESVLGDSCARQLGAPVIFPGSLCGMEFELPGCAWSVPKYRGAGLVIPLKEAALEPWTPTALKSPAVAEMLANEVEDIVSHVSAPGGALCKMLCSEPKRGQKTIFEEFDVVQLIEDFVIGPQGNAGDSRRVSDGANPQMRRVMEKLHEAVFSEGIVDANWLKWRNKLDNFRNKIRATMWKPLHCPAHNNLRCDRVLVDVFHSIWLIGFENSGTAPLLSDLARLSSSLLLECCRLPACCEDLVVCNPEDVARWLDVKPSSLVVEFVNELKAGMKPKAALMYLEDHVTYDGCSEEEYQSLCEHVELLVVATREEQLEMFNKAVAFSDAYAKQLLKWDEWDIEPPTEVDPEGLFGIPWRLQAIMMNNMAQNISKIFNGKEDVKTIDWSPLALIVPLLYMSLQMVAEQVLPPWQRLWAMKHSEALASQLFVAIEKHDAGGEKEFSMKRPWRAVEKDTAVFHGVQFSASHRQAFALSRDEEASEDAAAKEGKETKEERKARKGDKGAGRGYVQIQSFAPPPSRFVSCVDRYWGAANGEQPEGDGAKALFGLLASMPGLSVEEGSRLFEESAPNAICVGSDLRKMYNEACRVFEKLGISGLLIPVDVGRPKETGPGFTKNEDYKVEYVTESMPGMVPIDVNGTKIGEMGLGPVVLFLETGSLYTFRLTDKRPESCVRELLLQRGPERRIGHIGLAAPIPVAVILEDGKFVVDPEIDGAQDGCVEFNGPQGVHLGTVFLEARRLNYEVTDVQLPDPSEAQQNANQWQYHTELRFVNAPVDRIRIMVTTVRDAKGQKISNIKSLEAEIVARPAQVLGTTGGRLTEVGEISILGKVVANVQMEITRRVGLKLDPIYELQQPEGMTTFDVGAAEKLIVQDLVIGQVGFPYKIIVDLMLENGFTLHEEERSFPVRSDNTKAVHVTDPSQIVTRQATPLLLADHAVAFACAQPTKVFARLNVASPMKVSLGSEVFVEPQCELGPGLPMMNIPLRLQFSDVPIYPVASRLKVLQQARQGEPPYWRTGVIEKWLADGEYFLRFDGDEPGTPTEHFDPNLQSCRPGGVFCYQSGQPLVLFDPQSGWIEAEVAAEPKSNRHTVRIKKPGMDKLNVSRDLNEFNHSPAFLRLTDFDVEGRRYDRFIMARYSRFRHALAGYWADALTASFKLKVTQVHSKKAIDEWEALCALAEPSGKRHLGQQNVPCFLVKGASAAGKSCYCLRAAMVVLKQQNGFWPVVIDVAHMAQTAIAKRMWGNLVLEYLQDCFASDRQRILFLKQAMYSRRLVFIFDGMDEAGDLQHRVETHALRLARSGHRVLCTARSDALMPTAFPTKMFTTLELQPLDVHQRFSLAAARLGHAGATDFLRKITPYEDVAGSPLMFSMFLGIAEQRGLTVEGSWRSIDIYKEAILTVLTRIFAQEALHRGTIHESVDLLRQLLQRIALQLQREDNRDFSEESVQKFIGSLTEGLSPALVNSTQLREIPSKPSQSLKRATQTERKTLSLTERKTLTQARFTSGSGSANTTTRHGSIFNRDEGEMKKRLTSLWAHVKKETFERRMPLLTHFFEDGEVRLRFSHASFREYLASCEVVECWKSRRECALPSLQVIFWQSYWLRFLKFLFEQCVSHVTVSPQTSDVGKIGTWSRFLQVVDKSGDAEQAMSEVHGLLGEVVNAGKCAIQLTFFIPNASEQPSVPLQPQNATDLRLNTLSQFLMGMSVERVGFDCQRLGLGVEGAQKLLSALRNEPSSVAVEVNLSENDINEALTANLFDQGIVALRLDNNLLGDGQLRELGEALRRPTCRLEVLGLAGAGIRDNDLHFLADALAERGTCPLRSVDLSRNRIREEGTLPFMQVLKGIGGLEVLNLNGNPVGNCACRRLAPSLRILGLRNCDLDTEGVRALASWVYKSTTLERLDVSRNKLSENSLRHLSGALGTSSTLNELYLDSCQIQGSADLAEALRNNHVLRVLDLRRNFMRDIGSLAEAMEESHLQQIDLSGVSVERGKDKLWATIEISVLTIVHLNKMHLKDEDAKEIGQILQYNRSITTLGLAENNFTAVGAGYIAAGIVENTSLKQLDLASNTFGNAGLEAVTNALQVNSCIEVLDCSHIGITNGGAQNLANALESNNSLRQMALRGNQVGPRGMAQIADCLTKNTSLTELDLQGNVVGLEHDRIFGVKGVSCVIKALQANTSLRLLNLQDNRLAEECKDQLRVFTTGCHSKERDMEVLT